MNGKEIPRKIKFRHVHILGASGSGTSTLAKGVSKKLPHKHFDSDDFFWETKFTKTYNRNVRLNKLETELDKYNHWILSGAVIDWGNPLIPLFDLVIFISVLNEIRIQRLLLRAQKRYGDKILPTGLRYKEHVEFMEWASQYETGGFDIRSRTQQKTWLNNLSCEILEINGNHSVHENEEIVINTILE